jgi:hypothetical protein
VIRRDHFQQTVSGYCRAVGFKRCSLFFSRNSDFLIGVLVWFWVARPFLQPRRSVLGFDTLAYTAPNLDFIFSSWHRVKIPLWQPEMFGGVPFLGRLGSQGLYFPHLPFSFFEINNAIDLSVAFHLLLLSLGSVVLIRYGYKLPAPAGGITAAIVLCSAYIGIKALSFDQIIAISWFPWILFFVERIIERRSGRAMAGLVVATTCLVLGGHPQYVHLFTVLLIVVVAARLFENRSLRSLKDLGVCGVLVIGLCSLQLYATYSLTKTSVVGGRRTLELLASPSFTVAPQKLNLAIIGDPFSSFSFAVSGSTEAIAGVGIVAILLGVVGFAVSLFGQRKLTALALGLMTTLGALFAVGPKWIPFRLAYRLIPATGSARVPGRWLIMTVFGVAILAAIGIDALILQKAKLNARITASLLSVLVVGIGLSSKFEGVPGNLMYWWLVVLAITILALFNFSQKIIRGTTLIVLIGLLLFESNSSASHQTPRLELSDKSISEISQDYFSGLRNKPGKIIALTYDRLGDDAYLLSTLRPNTNLLQGLRSIDGYDGGTWLQSRWVAVASAMTNDPFNVDLTIRSQIKFPVRSDLLARFGVRWVITDTEVLPAQQQLLGFTGPVFKSGSIEIWENADWQGESLLYVATKSHTSASDVSDSLKNLSESDGTRAMVESSGPRLTCEKNCQPRTGRAVFQSTDSGAVRFNNDQPSVLVLNQSWSKDWKVYVDGLRTEIFPVDANMLGLQVPKGTHEVTYKYSPSWFTPLLLLSLFSGLITFSLIFRRPKGDDEFKLVDSID